MELARPCPHLLGETCLTETFDRSAINGTPAISKEKTRRVTQAISPLILMTVEWTAIRATERTGVKTMAKRRPD